MYMTKGRPALSRGTKQKKKEFELLLQSYSSTALENIIEIAEKSFNAETRLKANIYLLDRTYGKDYKATYNSNENDNKINIRLIPVETTYSPNNDLKNELQSITDNEDWDNNY